MLGADDINFLNFKYIQGYFYGLFFAAKGLNEI